MDQIGFDQIRKYKLVAQEQEIQELRELLRLKDLDFLAMMGTANEAEARLAPVLTENWELKKRNRRLVVICVVELMAILVAVAWWMRG